MICAVVSVLLCCYVFFFFKQKTAYEMRISDWSSDVCSSDLIPLETRDGEQLATKEDAQRIADEWSDSLYWRQGTSVSAVAMVFSMPAGTDPETVKQAVRETAERMIGDNHDYLMALHTDTPRPHVHLTVQAEG